MWGFGHLARMRVADGRAGFHPPIPSVPSSPFSYTLSLFRWPQTGLLRLRRPDNGALSGPPALVVEFGLRGITCKEQPHLNLTYKRV